MNKFFELLILLLVINKANLIGVGSNHTASYNGTTTNLKEIVIGRCHEFFSQLYKSKKHLNPNRFDCGRIWSSFSEAVIGKDPCSLRHSDFGSYLELTNHPIPPNTALFWSGSYTFAHESKIFAITYV